MTDSLESNDPPPEEQPVSIIDITDFLDYLRENVKLNLLGVKSVPPALDVALDDNGNLDCIKKFLSDPQFATLIVQKNSTKGKKQKKKEKTVMYYISFEIEVVFVLDLVSFLYNSKL